MQLALSFCLCVSTLTLNRVTFDIGLLHTCVWIMTSASLGLSVMVKGEMWLVRPQAMTILVSFILFVGWQETSERLAVLILEVLFCEMNSNLEQLGKTRRVS